MKPKKLLAAAALALLATVTLRVEEGVEMPPGFQQAIRGLGETDSPERGASESSPGGQIGGGNQIGETGAGKAGLSSAEAALLELINGERSAAGLEPFEVNDRLVAAARAHSADMAAHDFCEHEGSDGSSAAERIARFGYSAQWSGENIACGDDSAKAAMARWMGSDPHRRNIFHEHYTHIGIGMAPDGTWGPTWTLTFGANGR